ncbi:hypothetical protein [Actinokineospora sp. HUAS TT18]
MSAFELFALAFLLCLLLGAPVVSWLIDRIERSEGSASDISERGEWG